MPIQNQLITAAEFSPEGKLIYTGSATSTITGTVAADSIKDFTLLTIPWQANNLGVYHSYFFEMSDSISCTPAGWSKVFLP